MLDRIDFGPELVGHELYSSRCLRNYNNQRNLLSKQLVDHQPDADHDHYAYH